MEHEPKNPKVVQLEMAFLNVTSALGDIVAAVRAGKSLATDADPSLPSGMGTYLEVAEKKLKEAQKVLTEVSVPP